eukprot:TRINITY_DN39587_c0_g1_i1.p2 TRINITY_DN39587_c0_g1~~TRINITY_DN39587_c0_g1_i1.p2  ORF type:complete len:142 (+),score=32.90 TRINITY_DN39587_c0_g1_i1:2-427(+)
MTMNRDTMIQNNAVKLSHVILYFFFNDTATTEIYTRSIVGSVRCVQETVSTQSTWGIKQGKMESFKCDKPGHNDQTYTNISKDRKTLLCPRCADEDKYKGSPSMFAVKNEVIKEIPYSTTCLLYTSPSPRDLSTSRMPSSA